jgi:uncharacterized protein YbaP (TraB family)
MLFEVGRDGHAIHLFGGGPPPPKPWRSSVVEALATTCDEFWHEVPAAGQDAQAFAIKHGVDPSRPLDRWLNDADRTRLAAAARAVGANAGLLAPVRPWLAAQILKMALEARAEMKPENSAEDVLLKCASESGAAIRTEFPEPEAVFAYFASMGADAEVEYLRFTLDDVEAGPDALQGEAQAIADGDLRPLEGKAELMRTAYPALHEALGASRNRAWLPRIEAMFTARTRAFVVVGSGHLVGDDGLLALLRQNGFTVEPSRVWQTRSFQLPFCVSSGSSVTRASTANQ